MIPEAAFGYPWGNAHGDGLAEAPDDGHGTLALVRAVVDKAEEAKRRSEAEAVLLVLAHEQRDVVGHQAHTLAYDDKPAPPAYFKRFLRMCFSQFFLKAFEPPKKIASVCVFSWDE